MLRNQKGFTLIEIIAVLVILGILAAVAIPKFLDLQEESRAKAIEGAFAAGASQLSMGFASGLLRGTATATSWSYDLTSQLGDFNATLDGNCGNGLSTVTINDGGSPAWVTTYAGSKIKRYTICDAP